MRTMALIWRRLASDNWGCSVYTVHTQFVYFAVIGFTNQRVPLFCLSVTNVVYRFTLLQICVRNISAFSVYMTALLVSFIFIISEVFFHFYILSLFCVRSSLFLISCWIYYQIRIYLHFYSCLLNSLCLSLCLQVGRMIGFVCEYLLRG